MLEKNSIQLWINILEKKLLFVLETRLKVKVGDKEVDILKGFKFVYHYKIGESSIHTRDISEDIRD